MSAAGWTQGWLQLMFRVVSEWGAQGLLAGHPAAGRRSVQTAAAPSGTRPGDWDHPLPVLAHCLAALLASQPVTNHPQHAPAGSLEGAGWEAGAACGGTAFPPKLIAHSAGPLTAAPATTTVAHLVAWVGSAGCGGVSSLPAGGRSGGQKQASEKWAGGLFGGLVHADRRRRRPTARRARAVDGAP